MTDPPILTVGELIAALQRLPPDLKVWHEGCDWCEYSRGARSVEVDYNQSDKPVAFITSWQT